MRTKPKIIQADGRGYGIRARKFWKKLMARTERHRANRDPEHPPGYGKYRGYYL